MGRVLGLALALNHAQTLCAVPFDRALRRSWCCAGGGGGCLSLSSRACLSTEILGLCIYSASDWVLMSISSRLLLDTNCDGTVAAKRFVDRRCCRAPPAPAPAASSTAPPPACGCSRSWRRCWWMPTASTRALVSHGPSVTPGFALCVCHVYLLYAPLALQFVNTKKSGDAARLVDQL